MVIVCYSRAYELSKRNCIEFTDSLHYHISYYLRGGVVEIAVVYSVYFGVQLGVGRVDKELQVHQDDGNQDEQHAEEGAAH